jgi:predicted nucleic acid-binding Zn finger protein
MMEALFFLGMLLTTLPAGAEEQAPPAYRISGVVVDAVTGAPVAHAELSISVGPDEAKTAAGEDGRFVFQGLEAAKYPLFATAQGYVREGYNQHGGFQTAVVVGSEIDSEHVIFRLHRQVIITGRVTDEHGEAVRQAHVMLFGTESTSGRHARFVQAQMQTDDLGEYRFVHLQPGKYYVAVEGRPWYAQTGFSYLPEQEGHSFRSLNRGPSRDPSLDVVYPITFYPGLTDEQAAGQLNLTAGDKVEANIQLQAVPAVHVRLTNLPVGEIAIQIGATEKLFGTLDMELGVASAQISPGEYEVAGLPPGEVKVVVNQGGSQGSSSRTIRTNVSGGETLDGAGAGATANVSGRVIFPAGDANPARGQVSLVGEDTQGASAMLEKDGRFSFASVQEGAYKVFVNLPVSDEYVGGVYATGAKVSGREMTIAGAGDVQLSITMGRGVGQVTGVAKVDGKPTADVMVLLVPESGQNLEEDYRLDQSDSDGTFALGGILPGRYSLVAIEDGWDLEWTNGTVLKPYLTKGQTLQISANDQKKVVVEVQHKM